MAAFGGRFVIVGSTGPVPERLALGAIMGKELTVLGSLNGDVGDLHRAIGFLRTFRDRFAWDELFSVPEGSPPRPGRWPRCRGWSRSRPSSTRTDEEDRVHADPAPLTRRRRAEASVLSLGSWHTYDRMDFGDAVAMVRHAADSGINLFDVAVYGIPGVHPPVFTDVLFSAIVRAAGIARDDYLLSTKLWLEGYPEHSLRDQLANALFRVGADHANVAVLGDIRRDDIDLEQLAGTSPRWSGRACSAAGASTTGRPPPSGRSAGTPAPPVRRARSLAQLKYGPCRRSIPDGEPFAAVFAEGVAMQASDVLEGGILAGKSGSSRQIGRDPGGIPPGSRRPPRASRPRRRAGRHGRAAVHRVRAHASRDGDRPVRRHQPAAAGRRHRGAGRPGPRRRRPAPRADGAVLGRPRRGRPRRPLTSRPGRAPGGPSPRRVRAAAADRERAQPPPPRGHTGPPVGGGRPGRGCRAPSPGGCGR